MNPHILHATPGPRRHVLALLDGQHVVYPCRWDGERWLVQLACGVACRDAWEGRRVAARMAQGEVAA